TIHSFEQDHLCTEYFLTCLQYNACYPFLQAIVYGMNKLDSVKRSQVVSCLVEGNSIRATVRVTGVAKNTVVKLLCDLGRACSEYQDKVFRNLKCRRIQCDEIWSFVYAKEKNTTAEQRTKGCGDAWTWFA